MVNLAVSPCQVVKGWLHGSWPMPAFEFDRDWGVKVGKAVGNATLGASGVTCASGVTRAGKVGTASVGRGIGLAVMVGAGVFVGNAC